MSIQIEDLVNYGTDITDAVKRAKNGDYSGLQPGDLIAWTSGSLGRHIIIYAGMKNGTPWTVEFAGDGYRDRAMVVQVLYNKEGQPAVSGKHKFPDVPPPSGITTQ